MLCLLAPLFISLTACGELTVPDKSKDELAGHDTTRGHGTIVYPDSVPSIADGGVYWKQQNCAVCHADNGSGVPGKADVDLTNVDWMRQRKPVDQYMAITFGEGKEIEMPVLSSGEHEGNVEPIVKRTFEHPAYDSKLSRRQLWALVFYTRSLAEPLLSEEERNTVKAVFGGNCAVCHGARGAGDGDLNKGLVLQPAPANFTEFSRFYDRTDEQLWDHIANGIKWEGMPNFLGKKDRAKGITFDPPYIWKLVQYVRNFHEDAEFALETPESAAKANAGGGAVETAVPAEAASEIEGSPATKDSEAGAKGTPTTKDAAKTGESSEKTNTNTESTNSDSGSPTAAGEGKD